MYTKQDLNHDLYEICTKYHVKYQLLKNYVLQGIDGATFTDALSERDDVDLQQLQSELQLVQQKLPQNGTQLAESPIKQVNQLRQAGELNAAYRLLIPYAQDHLDDLYVQQSLGWLMYAYLKQSEANFPKYLKILNQLNALIQLQFTTTDQYLQRLLGSILWSIRRVLKGDATADAQTKQVLSNQLLPAVKQFVGGSPAFVALQPETQSDSTDTAYGTPGYQIVKLFIAQLDEAHYFELFDFIGLTWLRPQDYQLTVYEQDKKIGTFAERTIGHYAKTLLNAEPQLATPQRLTKLSEQLQPILSQYPHFKWLPWYQSKLLAKIGQPTAALSALVKFAQNNHLEYWTWEALADLSSGADRFNCLCAALLCPAKPEMLTKVQQKMIPLLVQRQLYAAAKYELNQLMTTRQAQKRPVPPELRQLTLTDWYTTTEVATDRTALQSAAKKAQRVLAADLPDTDIFVTYLNQDKGVVNFAYQDHAAFKNGYFYQDLLDDDFKPQRYTALKVKLQADPTKPERFQVFAVTAGDPQFAAKFKATVSGTFEQVKDYGFVSNNSVLFKTKHRVSPVEFKSFFVNPELVQQAQVPQLADVEVTVVKTWHQKDQSWQWQVAAFNQITPHKIEQADFKGIFVKVKDYGFAIDVTDNARQIRVTTEMVQQAQLVDLAEITGIISQKWQPKLKFWQWQLTSITQATAPDPATTEIDVEGDLDVTRQGFGFVDDYFVPAALIKDQRLTNNEWVAGRARKSWDQHKQQWSWTVFELR
jgi:hypothetical protein